MDWKEFLKPSKKKLILPILAVISIIILYIVPPVFGQYNFELPDFITILNLFVFFSLNFFTSFCFRVLFGSLLVQYYVLMLIFLSIVQFIFWYLMSCWSFDKFGEKLPKIILILVIVFNLILSYFWLEGPSTVTDFKNQINRQACDVLDPSTGCLHSPSAIAVNYDVNEDGEIEISNDNFQTFADVFYGCGGDSYCAKRICACPGLDLRGEYANVASIVDGDTLMVESDTHLFSIRLALVDAPEYNQTGYEEAKEFVSNMCPVGSEVMIDEDDGQTGGSYGRMVAVVYCDNKNVNEELLVNGHGTIDTRFCDDSEFGNEEWAVTFGC